MRFFRNHIVTRLVFVLMSVQMLNISVFLPSYEGGKDQSGFANKILKKSVGSTLQKTPCLGSLIAEYDELDEEDSADDLISCQAPFFNFSFYPVKNAHFFSPSATRGHVPQILLSGHITVIPPPAIAA